ncbi:hypothetical protein AJ80_02375 [Polytolypa hystricis UAMH7299]|uniref:Transcription factor domain-containing protein n=1 Tax=Polytolypa hystricis (strain UAMH7299) TaxID=1447883 RepID=A0A2B7YHM8_POLH7|nr:hypothetical protein AJ80_02375 [Polytolypa hystricis UAMH7299]
MDSDSAGLQSSHSNSKSSSVKTVCLLRIATTLHSLGPLTIALAVTVVRERFVAGVRGHNVPIVSVTVLNVVTTPLGNGCNNVGSLEDRLSNIEGELSRLMTLLQTSNAQKTLSDESLADESGTPFPSDSHVSKTDTPFLPTDRHIVRNQGDHMDRYHGPSTLFALCREFCDTVLCEQKIQGEELKDLLTDMCFEAGLEETFEFQSSWVPIRPPPKQFLMMAQGQFFDQADYATDIFVQSYFWANVERVYGRHIGPVDEAWAICFNVIILLVLGSEMSSQGNDPLVGSQFAQPFLLSVRSALSNPRVLMAPTLINVQALALLSIAAQQYYPPGFAASIFSQACVLARTMGLHQTNLASDGVSPEEAQERFKVFRSLYLRDKSFSISRGAICWLPSFDCSLSSELAHTAPVHPGCSARIQLATLQEDIYRLFYSAESQRYQPAKHKSELCRIDQSLERWANTHDIFSPSWSHPRGIDLRLEFLAARISAFRGSRASNHVQRALNDSRASCILLLMAYDKQDVWMVERLQSLPLSKSPSKSLGKLSPARSARRKSASKEAKASSAGKESTPEFVPLRLRSLLDTFPVPAFFLLVNNVLWPGLGDDEGETREDLKLIQKVCECYVELDARYQADNYTRKVGRAFNRLLAAISLLRNLPRPLTSPSGEEEITMSPHGTCPSGPPAFADFSDHLLAPSYLSPSLSHDSISAHNDPSIFAEGVIPDSSTSLLTPVNADYANQAFDPLQQQSFTHLPHPIPSPQCRKRPRLGDIDVSIEDADANSISEFLTTNNMMSF